MNWDNFFYFAVASLLCWMGAGIFVYTIKRKKYISDILMITGILVFAIFITGYWIYIERPPMRTMGETRLLYSLFIASIGYATYKRWKYKWLLSYSALLASVFVMINLLKPEIHSKNLMPALQSIWFVPHVTSYILSYSMLGAATIAAFVQLYFISKNKSSDNKIFRFTDNIVYVGFGFLLLGMLMGAIWAKEAWGHYWSWDPKETWAFVTASAYLVYIHLRLNKTVAEKIALWTLPVSFILLMITWIGVNYLPAAQTSVHVYGQ